MWRISCRYCTASKEALLLFLVFENKAVGRRPLWCVVELLPQDMSSPFVGRYRWGLQRLFAEEKPFTAYGTVFKTVARWRGLVPEWPKKIENLRKWVQSLCAPTRPFISKMKENLYHSLLPHNVDVHPYKNISLPRYRVPQKLSTCSGNAKSAR